MSAADEAAIEVIAVEEPIDISEFDAPETDFSGLDAPTEIHAPEESHMPEESLAPERPRALEEAHKGKTVMESVKADKAVMDVMAERQAWRTDRPGSPIKNIVSAISLNDRVLLINVLFKEDPMLFQETIAAFNAMGSLDEAVSYIKERFPDWNLNSESVYRLMMAVRRKLK